MFNRKVLFTSAVAILLAACSQAANADKISTLDFYELPNKAKMSQVIATVGQPNEKKSPDGQPLIEWYYDSVTWHKNGQPVTLVLFFDKNTERLDLIRGPDGLLNKSR